MNKVYNKRIQVLNSASRALMPKLLYHNFRHAKDVFSVVGNYAALTGLNESDIMLLESAALLHDIVMIPVRTDNEEKSAEFAQRFLPNIGYSESEVERIGKLILATKVPQRPNDYLEQLICDADLDNFGREDFFEIGSRFRRELGLKEDDKWNQGILKLLKGHRYHTEVARALRDTGKEENLRRIENIVGRG